jgi:hypothetical protein
MLPDKARARLFLNCLRLPSEQEQFTKEEEEKSTADSCLEMRPKETIISVRGQNQTREQQERAGETKTRTKLETKRAATHI